MAFKAFDGILLSASLLTLFGVIRMSQLAFKKHYMNVFTFLILTLIIFALIVRSAFFFIDVGQQDFTFDGTDPTQKINPGAQRPELFAMLWTYPIINYILAAYVLSGRWVYDLIILHNP